MAKKNDDFLAKIKASTNKSIEKKKKPNPHKQDTVFGTSKILNFSNIPVNLIEPNPKNPRSDFDEVALNELATSLKVHGLVQPITVRNMGNQKYQLISGERRWRASKIANLEKIPAYIRKVDNDQEMLEMALVENIQRENLNPVEVAFTYDRLLKECNLTHDELAERLGKARTTITHKLGLLELPSEVIIALRDKVIYEGHAKAIKGLSKRKNQEFVLGQITLNDLSVRETEKLVNNIKDGLLELPPGIVNELKAGKIKVGHAMALCALANIDDQLYVLGEIKRATLSVEKTEELVERMNKKSNVKPKKKRLDPNKDFVDKCKRKISEAFGSMVDMKLNDKGKGKVTITIQDNDALEFIMERIDILLEGK